MWQTIVIHLSATFAIYTFIYSILYLGNERVCDGVEDDAEDTTASYSYARIIQLGK